MANSTPQNISDFNALYEQAKESQVLYAKTMKEYLVDVKNRYPGLLDDVRFEQGSIKSTECAWYKIKGDYNGEVEKIGDLVRGRFVVDTAEQADILRKDFPQHSPAKIEEFKDHFAEPTETMYRAVIAKVRLDNGHVAEFRIEHAAMLKAADATHELHAEIQKLEFAQGVPGQQIVSHIETKDTSSNSQELQAKIDALPYEDLKICILNHFNRFEKRKATEGEIFEVAIDCYMQGRAHANRQIALNLSWRMKVFTVLTCVIFLWGAFMLWMVPTTPPVEDFNRLMNATEAAMKNKAANAPLAAPARSAENNSSELKR